MISQTPSVRTPLSNLSFSSLNSRQDETICTEQPAKRQCCQPPAKDQEYNSHNGISLQDALFRREIGVTSYWQSAAAEQELSHFLSIPKSSLQTEFFGMPISLTSARNTNGLIAIGSECGSVVLADIDTGRLVSNHKENENAIFGLDFSFDDRSLAACHGGSGIISIYDTETVKVKFNMLGGSMRGSVKQTKYQPDSSDVIVSCSRNGDIVLYDCRIRDISKDDEDTLHINSKPEVIVNAHRRKRKESGMRLSKKEISITSIEWIDQNMLATGSEANEQIKVWDIRKISKGKLPLVTESPVLGTGRSWGVTSLQISGDRLWSLTRKGEICEYQISRLDEGPAAVVTSPDLIAGSFYSKLALSPSSQTSCLVGNYLAAGSSTGHIVLLPINDKGPIEPDFEVLEPSTRAESTGVIWTCSGDLVSASDDFIIRTWKPISGQDPQSYSYTKDFLESQEIGFSRGRFRF